MLDIVFSASALGALKVGIPLRERAVRQAVALESALSVGDISEGVPGPGREAALRAFLAPAEGATVRPIGPKAGGKDPLRPEYRTGLCPEG